MHAHIHTGNMLLRFDVFTVASMKMVVFWVVVPCSLLEVYLMMKAASTYETLVPDYMTLQLRRQSLLNPQS
jgi:hypothetical protein